MLEHTSEASPTTSKPWPQKTVTVSPGSYQSFVGLNTPFFGFQIEYILHMAQSKMQLHVYIGNRKSNKEGYKESISTFYQ